MSCDFTRSNCLIYKKSGNMVRKSAKNRENYQQNRGKSDLFHSQYWHCIHPWILYHIKNTLCNLSTNTHFENGMRKLSYYLIEIPCRYLACNSNLSISLSSGNFEMKILKIKLNTWWILSRRFARRKMNIWITKRSA